MMPNVSPAMMAQFYQWLAMQQRGGAPGMRVSGGYPDLVGGGYVDISGAEVVDISGADPDAEVLLSGLDAAQIGAEVIGYDASAIGAEDIDVGAAPRRIVRRIISPAQVAAAQRRAHLGQLAHEARLAKAFANQPAIVDKEYKTTRTVPLGIDSQVDVPAGTTVIIPIVPNGPYKVRYLLIPDDVAPDFALTTLFFGRVNGLGGAQEVPATTYAESADAKQNEFDVPMMIPGIPIQLGVRNKAGVPRRFQARFQGQVFENT